MAEDNWVFVERFGGRLRRVTVLDDCFHVIATHDRGAAPDGSSGDDLQGECRLVRSVTLDRRD